MDREHALDSFAVGNAPDRERFVQAPAFATDDDARKNLDPLLVAFDDPGMHADAVADLEFGHLSLELLLFDSVNNAVHNGFLGRAGGRTFSGGGSQIANGYSNP